MLGETFGMSGEAASRSDIRLPENQINLLKALKNRKANCFVAHEWSASLSGMGR